MPIAGVVSDGQTSIRKAVKKALDGVPHQLYHFHYLREAALPVYEADRHGKVQLTKKVRGIRPIERTVEGRADDEAEAIRGYGAAVRSALIDDGRPPLEAPGLKLAAGPPGRGRRQPGPGGRPKGLPKELSRLRAILAEGFDATATLWPDVCVAFGWVHRAAAILRNKKGLDAAGVRRRYRGLIDAIARHGEVSGHLAGAFEHFRKVTQSYWAGLFRCYEVAGLPRTNNDLEPFFGSYRYHERRASGRKAACPGTVVRGSVRVVAATATRLRSIGVGDLVPSDLKRWRELRDSLERRQAVRTLGRRFRRDPVAYLQSLEESPINQALPA